MTQIDTLIDVMFHTIWCLVAGYLAWRRFMPNNRKVLSLSIIVALCAGLFNDVDHFFDYFMAHGFHFNLVEFTQASGYLQHTRYLLLHGFEYVILAAIGVVTAKAKKWKMIFSSIMLSHFLHIMVDSLFYVIPIIDYSIIYRALHGFHV